MTVLSRIRTVIWGIFSLKMEEEVEIIADEISLSAFYLDFSWVNGYLTIFKISNPLVWGDAYDVTWLKESQMLLLDPVNSTRITFLTFGHGIQKGKHFTWIPDPYISEIILAFMYP